MATLKSKNLVLVKNCPNFAKNFHDMSSRNKDDFFICEGNPHQEVIHFISIYITTIFSVAGWLGGSRFAQAVCLRRRGVCRELFPGSWESFPGSREEFQGSWESFPGSRKLFPGSRESFPGYWESFTGSGEAFKDDFPSLFKEGEFPGNFFPVPGNCFPLPGKRFLVPRNCFLRV